MNERYLLEYDEPVPGEAEEPAWEHALDHLIYIQQALREADIEGEAAATA